jgi:RNA polymerase primary sigma factor
MKQLRIMVQATNRDSLSLDKYLYEISKFKLLTPEEEVVLAGKIRQGDRKALETLVNCNLRFVVSVAKQHYSKGMPLADLINEGNLGLIKAAQLFDETKGFKFISYAVWWIRQSILQATSELSRIVRLPSNIILSFNKVNKAFIELEQNFQREPSLEEISEITDLQLSVIESSININHYHVSMDAPFSDDENSDSLYDVMGDNNFSSPDNSLLEHSLQFEVKRTLATLNDKEEKVIRFFYGIDGTAYSLEEIGQKMNLTRERVRQIRDKALNRLQKYPRNKLLKKYVA